MARMANHGVLMNHLLLQALKPFWGGLGEDPQTSWGTSTNPLLVSPDEDLLTIGFP